MDLNNITDIRHKKELSENNMNFYNRINNNFNQTNNQIINYKKELIEEFCYCLEEFIFMNVKNNFDTFITNLNNYCKDKHFNNLLLKRLQNKTIQKNFYKEKASSYKYLETNSSNPHYSSIIMMNNSNIINVQRKDDYINNDFSKDFCGRKTFYNFRNTQSPPLTEKIDRIQKNYRFGKSQEPLDINNMDNYYNNYTYFHNNNLLENYNNFNYYNSINYNKKKNYNNINNIINNEDDEEKKSLIKYDTNYIDNNLYIPKKLKKVGRKILSKSNERLQKLINDSDLSNPYINKIKAKKIFKHKFSPQNEINRSHELNNDIIRAKLNKNYNMNYLKKMHSMINSDFQDISCDMNSNYNNRKDNEILFNRTNETIIKRNNTELNQRNTYDYRSNEILPVYRKKIKINQIKSNIYINKAFPNNIRNKMIQLNCANKTADQLLSPKIDKKNNNINNNINKNINEKAENLISINSSNSKNINNKRNVNTEPRREINNNMRETEQNKFGKIQELTVNLSRKENLLINNNKISNNNNSNIYINEEENNTFTNEDNFNDDVTTENNGKLLTNEKDQINQTKNKNNNENDNKEKNNNEFNKEENSITDRNDNNINENENNQNTETITINNETNDFNAMSNSNNIINDDTDESDENVTKEIIVKDVSTRDKRLNVFIKYVELSHFNTINNEFNNFNFFNIFQTDSIFVPSLFPKKDKNYYYDKYFYGNKNEKNNKLKLHQILSSIIEEEEKSKAAGSINNSYLSDEDTSKHGNNYSHFYIQSIKYVSNYLQSIFDDKKKDMYFKFFKILKKIKNEAFLRGLMNQKKFQTLNKSKEEEKKNKKNEKNDNSISEDIILYNENENYEKDNNNSDLKSKEKKENDLRDNIYSEDESDHKSKRKNNKNINNEDNNNSKINFDIKVIKVKKYSSENKNDINIRKLSFDNDEINDNKSFSFFEFDKTKEIRVKKIINYNKLKKMIEHFDKLIKNKLIGKSFKFWKNLNNEKENIIISEKKENSQIDYEKNVTISEACRGLDDVILDFKIYLIKFFLKNRKEKH